MKTKEDWAKILNGRRYGHEVQVHELKELKAGGFVVVHGYSDDVVLFDGAISGSEHVFDGGDVYVDADGIVQSECGCEDCPPFLRRRKKARKIEARWPGGELMWEYKTDIPHAVFDVMWDGDLYCRGIVFNLSDL